MVQHMTDRKGQNSYGKCYDGSNEWMSIATLHDNNREPTKMKSKVLLSTSAASSLGLPRLALTLLAYLILSCKVYAVALGCLEFCQS